MNGGAHATVGFIVGMSCTAIPDVPSGIIKTIMVVGAVIGSLLPDLDTRSWIHKIIDNVTTSIWGAVVIVFLFRYRWFKNYQFEWNRTTILIAISLFIFIMFSWSTHRGLTHSFLGSSIVIVLLILFNVPGIIIFSTALGIASHIVLDMTTPRGVRIFYPYGKYYKLL